MAVFLRPVSAALICFALAAPAVAQTPPSDPPVSSRSFMPRSAFEFSWARLFTNDRRFYWDARIRLDLDIAEVDGWQMRFSADYDAVIGRERRVFDLNQGLYLVEGTIGHDVRGTGVAFLAQHVSRHLVDRENPPAISWNLAGVRLTRRLVAGRTTVEGKFDLGHAMQQAFVDYTWISQAEVRGVGPINARLSWVAEATGDLVLVNHLVRDHRVCGGRIEGALRVNGRVAAVDVVLGYERRIDGFPTDRFRVRAFTLGFRLVSK
ncbi:MAG TPA: hypothetical protein VF424_04750 [Vicinamibacterales bacterium]